MTASTTTIVPEEDRIAGALDTPAYHGLVHRLSERSVTKHFDAYADIAWDDPDMAIDHDDPRWMLPEDEALGATAWYRAQPAGVQSRIGLHMAASFMKIGLEFESVLKRGLLEFAAGLPNGSPEFRYVYHEIAEETHHAMMFQEFVNRTGFDVPGMAWWHRIGARRVIHFGRSFPELFFVFVLGGEDPIDHVQRTALRRDREMHPLLRRIMQIHVTEEARHLCFARHYLMRNVGRLSPVRRFILSHRAPVILAIMSQMMMRPSGQIVREYGIPAAVVREAYTNNPAHKARTLEALAKIRGLLADLDLIPPGAAQLWQVLGLRPTPA